MKKKLAIIASTSAILLLSACAGGSPQPTSNATQNGAGAGAPLASSLPAYLKDADKIRVGLDCGAPPFTFKDSSGEPVGAEVDIAKEIVAMSLGDESKAEFTCLDPASRIPFLTTKKVDIVIAQLSITQERLKQIGISKPYLASSIGFLVKKGNEFTGLGELEGKTVSTSASAPYFELFKNSCDTHWNELPLKQTSLGIEALTAGRTDAYISDITRSYGAYKDNPKIVLSGPDLSGIGGYATGIGFRKDETATGKWLDEAIDQLQKSDSIWKALDQWMEPDQLKQIEAMKAVPRPDFDPDYKRFAASWGPIEGCPVKW